MKINLKKLALISLSISALVPMTFPSLSLKAETLTASIKQNQAIPYPINDPDVIAYRDSCRARVLKEYQGATEADANSICNCILNRLHRQGYRTLSSFRTLRRNAVNNERNALRVMENAGIDCAIESDLLYEN